MGETLTVLALAAACAVLAVKILAANRRAAGERKRAGEERELRRAREDELRDRVGRARKRRDPLELARRAVGDDPGRAAKTLSRMMKKE